MLLRGGGRSPRVGVEPGLVLSDRFANCYIFSFVLPVIGVVGEVVKFVGVIRGLEEDPSSTILFYLSASLSFI